MKTKTMGRIAAIALTAALVLPVTGQTPSDAAAKKPQLSAKAGTTYVGYAAKAKINNIKKSNIKKLTVKSSDASVATAKKSGLTIVATGVTGGSATITANLKLKKAVKKKKSFKLSFKVTVKDFSELTTALGAHSAFDTDFTAKYVEFLQSKTAADFPKGLCVAVVDAKAPVLLIADEVFRDGSTYEAGLYVYDPFHDPADVVFLNQCTSNSAAYSLLASDGYVIWGSHHYSSRMTVDPDEKKCVVERIDGILLDSTELTHTVTTIPMDGSAPEEKSDTVTIKVGDDEKYDYYGQALSPNGTDINDDAVIKFIKISD